MKALSIIGIVWSSLSLFCVLAFIDSDPDASSGWGLLGLIYALGFAITALVMSLKKEKTNVSIISAHEQLLKLNELREKNIISEDEFNKKKAELLTGYSV